MQEVAPDCQSVLDPITRFENNRNADQANDHEKERHAHAQRQTDVGRAEEAPSEPADQIDDGVEQGDLLPERRKHGDGIEASTQKRKRRDHHQRDHLKFLEAVSPNANDKSEKTEGNGSEQKEEHHPKGMKDCVGHEEPRRA